MQEVEVRQYKKGITHSTAIAWLRHSYLITSIHLPGHWGAGACAMVQAAVPPYFQYKGTFSE